MQTERCALLRLTCGLTQIRGLTGRMLVCLSVTFLPRSRDLIINVKVYIPPIVQSMQVSAEGEKHRSLTPNVH
jgi:hypothetical protein